MQAGPHTIFLTGGTGYIGSRLRTLVSAVENPCVGTRIVDVPQIRQGQVP